MLRSVDSLSDPDDGALLAISVRMRPTMRAIVMTILASAWIVVVVSPRHRRAVSRKLADARRFVSHRLVDTEARASSRAVDRWEGEGGATRG
jgi:hypothetical protein